MTATITEHVRRYVAMKRKMGYVYRHSHILTSFAQFAEDRDEAVIRSETVLAWISASQGVSPSHRVTKLRTVHAFACWLRAEDPRHEVPHRDALAQHCRRRPPPHLVSFGDPPHAKRGTLRASWGHIAPLEPGTICSAHRSDRPAHRRSARNDAGGLNRATG